MGWESRGNGWCNFSVILCLTACFGLEAARHSSLEMVSRHTCNVKCAKAATTCNSCNSCTLAVAIGGGGGIFREQRNIDTIYYVNKNYIIISNKDFFFFCM